MMLKDSLIISSQGNGLQYFLMVVSATVMIDGTQDQRTTRIFGKGSENRNIQHGKEIISRFESRRWIVIRVWECKLKKKNRE